MIAATGWKEGVGGWQRNERFHHLGKHFPANHHRWLNNEVNEANLGFGNVGCVPIAQRGVGQAHGMFEVALAEEFLQNSFRPPLVQIPGL